MTCLSSFYDYAPSCVFIWPLISPHLPHLAHLPHLPYLPYLPCLPYLPHLPHYLIHLIFSFYEKVFNPYGTAIWVDAKTNWKPVMQRECLCTMCLQGNLLCNENVCLQCVYKGTCYATRIFVYNVFTRKPVMQRECLFTMCVQGNLQFGLYLNHELRFFSLSVNL